MITRFFKQLMDRRVVHAAAAYLGTSLVLLRLAETIADLFGLTDLFEQTLALTLIVGFPISMIWMWRHGAARAAKRGAERASVVELEVYGDGATQDLKLDPAQARKLLMMVMAVLVLAVLAMVIDRLLPRPDSVVESTPSAAERPNRPRQQTRWRTALCPRVGVHMSPRSAPTGARPIEPSSYSTLHSSTAIPVS